MSDKELLELAAKAVGPKVVRKVECSDGFELVELSCGLRWNPLEDDGAALRLAVNLRLDILVDGQDSPNAFVEVVANHPGVETQPWAAEPMKVDQFAATRRAIVRAAAEIGKSMQP